MSEPYVILSALLATRALEAVRAIQSDRRAGGAS